MMTFARINRVSSLLSLLSLAATFTSSITASALPTNSSLHYLEKRDPSYVPSNIALEGCSVRDRNFAPYKKNEGIQMSECYVNARIVPQAFAWFEPDPDMTASREGGPYGTCYATSKFPSNDGMINTPNVNYACFLWTDKGLGQVPQLAGKEFIPFPLICPSNLDGCYSQGAYNPGGHLAKWANIVPTASGMWRSSKDSKHDFMWCNHITPECPAVTYLDLQLENINKTRCDVSKCPKYQGNVAILDASTRASSKGGLQPGPSYRIVNGVMTNAPASHQTFLPGNGPTTGTPVPGAEVPPTVPGGTGSGESGYGGSTGGTGTEAGGGSTGGTGTEAGGGSAGGTGSGLGSETGSANNGAAGNNPPAQTGTTNETPSTGSRAEQNTGSAANGFGGGTNEDQYCEEENASTDAAGSGSGSGSEAGAGAGAGLSTSAVTTTPIEGGNTGAGAVSTGETTTPVNASNTAATNAGDASKTGATTAGDTSNTAAVDTSNTAASTTGDTTNTAATTAGTPSNSEMTTGSTTSTTKSPLSNLLGLKRGSVLPRSHRAKALHRRRLDI